LFVIIAIIAYFTDNLQGNVETHLWCGTICNKHIIANCPQSVPVKKFENRSTIGENMDKSKLPRFLANPVCKL